MRAEQASGLAASPVRRGTLLSESLGCSPAAKDPIGSEASVLEKFPLARLSWW